MQVCGSLLRDFRVEALQHYQKETPKQVFYSEVWEIFKNTFFYRTPLVDVSGDNKSHTRHFTLRTRHVPKTAYYLWFYRQ